MTKVKESAKTITFEACGTFGAIGKAEEYLKEHGYRVGSLCVWMNPMGFAPADKYSYIA